VAKSHTPVFTWNSEISAYPTHPPQLKIWKLDFPTLVILLALPSGARCF